LPCSIRVPSTGYFRATLSTDRQWNRRAKISCRSPDSRHVLPGDLTALGTPRTYAITCDLRVCSRKTVFVYHTALCRTSRQLVQNTEAAQQASHSGREDTLQSSLRSQEWNRWWWYSERHNLPPTPARESSHARCLRSVRFPLHLVSSTKFMSYSTTIGWLCEELTGDDFAFTHLRAGHTDCSL
jgi:hypothetical protein